MKCVATVRDDKRVCLLIWKFAGIAVICWMHLYNCGYKLCPHLPTCVFWVSFIGPKKKRQSNNIIIVNSFGHNNHAVKESDVVTALNALLPFHVPDHFFFITM